MFEMGEIVHSYGVEEAIADGVFIDVTDKAKKFIKWQTVITETIMNKIESLNDDDDARECLIVDIAQMYIFAMKGRFPCKKEDNRIKYMVSLKADLSGGDTEIIAVININSIGKPVLTFCLECDL